MEEKPRVLVSLCLLGIECRYDGRGNACEGLNKLVERCEIVPVCPEQLGGLPTPRTPAERRDGRVVTKDGRDVTEAFKRGADQVCRLAEALQIRWALLKARSPSCGTGKVYDGTFAGRLIPGMGVTALALYHAGIPVYDDEHIDDLIQRIDEERENHHG